MKNKNFKITLLSLMLLILTPFFCGCKNSTKQETVVQSSLSEYRKNLFVGNGSGFSVTFTSGEREEPYVMDGENQKLKDFGVLTLKFNNLPANLPQFELKVNEKTYTGQFEKNPYDNTFVYDICTQVNDEDNLNLYLVDFDEYVKLDCVSKNWQFDYVSALNIFSEKYKEEIKNQTENNVLNAEIYVKIVTDSKNMENIYWYVLMVCKKGDMFASLIDTKTGQIIQN